MSTYVTWCGFVLALAFVGGAVRFGFDPAPGSFVHVDGLTMVMWVAVTFFSGIVQSFSRRYMAADPEQSAFFARILSFTVAVLVMTAANHVAVFLAAWLAMGVVMAGLIGHVDGWRQARAAGRLARRYFLGGGALLGLALLVLVQQTGATTLTGILSETGTLPRAVRLGSAALVVAAALVQSALLPFHRWLLSSMTAPTPSSALMHAGFVNAGGILLTRLAPLLAWSRTVLLLVAVAGTISALGAQAMMLVQPTYKGRLGCSTVAQMGFMILQCGLGYFAAAVTHLVVHGFYKAYLFLSTGSRVEQTAPKPKHDGGSLASTLVALGTAVAGGVVFATLTGKGLDPSSTGVFLSVIVVVSVYQGSSELLRLRSLSPVVRLVGFPAVMLPALALYALLYNGISSLLYGLPMIDASVEMSAVHWLLLGAFVLGHLAIDRGWLQRSTRLYMALLNATQPDPRTIPTRHREFGVDADPSERA